MALQRSAGLLKSESGGKGVGKLLRPSAPSLLVIPFFPSCRLNNEQFCRAVEITFSRGHLSALINIFRRKWSETSRLPKTETNWRFYAMSNQSFLYMFEFNWLDRTGWGDVSFKVVRWNNDWTFFHIRHLYLISGSYSNHLHCYILKRQLFDSANDWIYKKPDVANSPSQESSS